MEISLITSQRRKGTTEVDFNDLRRKATGGQGVLEGSLVPEASDEGERPT